MDKIKCYLTKDLVDCVELWKSKPVFNREKSQWEATGQDEFGTEITDAFLDTFLGEGECIEIEIVRKKTIYDYFKIPEGKLMNTIFNNKKNG